MRGVTVTEVPISALDRRWIEAGRPHLDAERVSFYVEHLAEAAPVTVFDTGDHLVLADGHHRVAAAERLGRTTISAEVRRGGPGDALRFAVDLATVTRELSRPQVLAAIMRRSAGAATAETPAPAQDPVTPSAAARRT
jgi:hypothetical protein